MALSGSDLAIIETNYGRVPAEELEDIESRVTRLGSAHAAALELLLIERADADKALDEVTSADFRGRVVEKRRRLDDAIDRLVSFLQTTNEVTLTATGQRLLDRAVDADAGDATTIISVTSQNARRGG